MISPLSEEAVARINKKLARKLDEQHYTHVSDAYSMLSVSPGSLDIQEDSFQNIEESSVHKERNDVLSRLRLDLVRCFGKFYRTMIAYTAVVLLFITIFLIDILMQLVIPTDVTLLRLTVPKVAVFAFSFIFTWFIANRTRASLQEIMVAGATYAAVLVVFISKD
jgi:hypothetical protein